MQGRVWLSMVCAKSPAISSDLNPFPDLIVSMLAVNNFSLERGYSLHDALDKQGLLNVEKIALSSTEALSSALAQAGYVGEVS